MLHVERVEFPDQTYIGIVVLLIVPDCEASIVMQACNFDMHSTTHGSRSSSACSTTLKLGALQQCRESMLGRCLATLVLVVRI